MNTNNRVVHPVNNSAKLGIEDTMLKIDGWNTELNCTKTGGCVTLCIDLRGTLFVIKLESRRVYRAGSVHRCVEDSDAQNPSADHRSRIGDRSFLSRESVVQGEVGIVEAINETSSSMELRISALTTGHKARSKVQAVTISLIHLSRSHIPTIALNAS